MKSTTATLYGLVLAALAGCGGGGDSAGPETCQVGVSTMRFPTGCPVEPAGGAVTAPSIALSLRDAAGAPVTQVAPGQPATLRALVKDNRGAVAPGVAVTFGTSDKTGVFVPSSGTALTDAQGVAQLTLPAGAQAGAFTLTASTSVAGVAVSGTAAYAVVFPVLTLSPLVITPASLSAGGTSSLSVTVQSGSGVFAPAQSVSFTSPCVAAGKASISSPVVTVGGVASTSYTDKGCGAADTVTASTQLGDSTATRTGTLNVLPATAGQIAFVSALPQNIALKGTGGPGRQESSTVTFKVLDRSGNPVAGVPVDFLVFSNTGSATGTGGLTLSPARATSGADGSVSTVVVAGGVPTPVRLSATLSGSTPPVTSISDQLVISTGIPDQDSFSLSTRLFNVEGMNHDGCPEPVGSTITISLADHFNNPVPDGTAVSFTAEGGTVGASCLTGLVNTQLTNGTAITQKGVPGQCSVSFCAAQPRPDNGRVTILAYALGEESYRDDPAIANGINRYDPGEPFQDLCEPFRYDAAITSADANPTLMDARDSRACPSPALGEPYIDTNGDGLYTRTGDGQYNGVLNIDPATGQTVANGRKPTVHVRRALVQVLSGSQAVITPLGAAQVQLDHCVDGTPFANLPQTFALAIRDDNPTVFPGNTLAGNILPAGTRIEFATTNGKLLSEPSALVPNTDAAASAVWTYYLTLQSDATQSGPGTSSGGVTSPGYLCTNPSGSGLLTVKVTTPLGVVTTRALVVTD